MKFLTVPICLRRGATPLAHPPSAGSRRLAPDAAGPVHPGSALVNIVEDAVGRANQ